MIKRIEKYFYLKKVSDSKVKQYCSQKGNIAYFETSAKEAYNVDNAFEEVARLAFKREQKDDEMYLKINISYIPKTVELKKPANNQPKSGGCC